MVSTPGSKQAPVEPVLGDALFDLIAQMAALCKSPWGMRLQSVRVASCGMTQRVESHLETAEHPEGLGDFSSCSIHAQNEWKPSNWLALCCLA